MIGLGILGSIGSVSYNYNFIKQLPEENILMQRIAKAIRRGANTFIKYEYQILIVAMAILAAIFVGLYQNECGLSFLLGAFLSASTGLIEMRAANYGNVRVTNMANETKSKGKTLSVALRTGSIMGQSVHTLASWDSLFYSLFLATDQK